MLVYQNWVPVGVKEEHMPHSRPRFISLLRDLDSTLLERTLDVSHVVECRRMAARSRPTGIEGQRVRVKHSLEKPNRTFAVPKDDPVLVDVSADDLEIEFFVKITRLLDVLDCKTDGKCAQIHNVVPFLVV